MVRFVQAEKRELAGAGVVTEKEHRHTQLVFYETLAKLPDAAPRTD